MGSHKSVESRDLLHGLKAVASGHRVTALPNQGIPANPHSEGTGSIPVKLSLSPSL
ncbi:hypothetical protein SAMN05216388_10862 [Halorientalis persicus]|uniref:Uncharacterized protein n=1 Tax=Halorientalis persicus TaxID=1367881 RepID=A0A1H8WX76_9EURY|nr:hypothetical protein SAMN05216388_10862 [Halorientalis persicus]